MLHSWGNTADCEKEYYINSLLDGKIGLGALLTGLPCGAICSVYTNESTPFVDSPQIAIANETIYDIFGLNDVPQAMRTFFSSRIRAWVVRIR